MQAVMATGSAGGSLDVHPLMLLGALLCLFIGAAFLVQPDREEAVEEMNTSRDEMETKDSVVVEEEEEQAEASSEKNSDEK